MPHLPLPHAIELVLVAVGAFAHVHAASARSRNARSLWFNPMLFGWTLCWSSWYALSFITLNLETLDYGRTPVVSMCLDVVKGTLINLQAGLLLHGIARWTGIRRIPPVLWYLLPASYVVAGFGPVLAAPMNSFLRNIDGLVLLFLLCDAFQTGVGAFLLHRSRGDLSPVGLKVAIPLERALALSVPLLLGSAALKWSQGSYRAGDYDWVLLFDLAHLLPPAALLFAAYRTGTVALDVTRATIVRAAAFAIPFAAYLALKLSYPASMTDRILTFVVAGMGFLLLVGPLPLIAARNLSRTFNLGMQRESVSLSRLDERLRRGSLPSDPVRFAARCIGRILSLPATVLDSTHPSVATIIDDTGRDGIATLGRSSTRDAILAWEDLGGRILLPVAERRLSGPRKAILLGSARRSGKLPVEIMARLSVVLASLQAALDAQTELHERLEAERRLQEGERLAMLGLLSASAAHEIRNPLSAIRNIVHAALGDAPEGSTIRADLAMIASEVDRLDATVRRMLQFARDRGTCDDAGATLESTCGLLDQEARAKGIQLQLSSPGGIRAPMSENDLKATLFNLVLNALQHAPGGSTVSVRLSSDGPCLEVENEGEIPDDFRHQLFLPLASRGGTGLGLYISRKRAEESGGKLVHEPLPGRTLFRLSWSPS